MVSWAKLSGSAACSSLLVLAKVCAKVQEHTQPRQRLTGVAAAIAGIKTIAVIAAAVQLHLSHIWLYGYGLG